MNARRQQQDSLELMTLAASGDSEAQRAVVERLRRRVQTVALTVLGNAMDAEDAAQNGMMEILRSAGSFRGENLTAWADRIAVRTAMRYARQRRVRAARHDELEPDELPGSSPDLSPNAALPRPLLEYVGELPEARRVVLVLRHVMGYSIAEIAELTETSPNTVKDRLVHARAELRKRLRRDLMIAEATERRRRS